MADEGKNCKASSHFPFDTRNVHKQFINFSDNSGLSVERYWKPCSVKWKPAKRHLMAQEQHLDKSTNLGSILCVFK